MYKLKVPGKLYLLGEYNVLADGHSAILFAIDRYIKVSIADCDTFVLVNEKQVYPLHVDQGKVSVEDDSLKISESALQIAIDYLQFLGLEIRPFRLHLNNQLVNEDGTKYGFGSSAAILVAILRAVFTFHQLNVSNFDLFKIAVLGQHILGKKTSGGDLAAVIYGGLIYYRRYAYEWLKAGIKRGFNLIGEEWPMLAIVQLPHQKLDIAIGWTNSAHSTDANLGKILNRRDDFHEFSDKAEKIVIEAKAILEGGDLRRLGPLIARYQALLYKLDFDLELGFNTDILNRLIKCAADLGGYSKISGAGYGDCGLAIVDNKLLLEKAWSLQGIRLIKYKIAGRVKG